MLLGRQTIGDGPQRVIVLHDWMGDHRNYAPMMPFLDRETFTYAFVDLRGYGLSRAQTGRYDLAEATEDVLALASQLGWTGFQLVGHSMSSLVAQQVAASAPDHVASLVLLTPVAPAGMHAPEPAIAFMEQVGGDEDARAAGLAARWGDRYVAGWRDFKLSRWRESARAEAARGYVRMFATEQISGALPAIPVLAVIGEHDAEPFREATVRAGFAAYPRFELAICPGAGHYPMQETPVTLATILERFLARIPG